MTTATTSPSPALTPPIAPAAEGHAPARRDLADRIVERARVAAARLEAHPFYGRLLAGQVDAEGYAAWLVQLHGYVQHTVRGERGLADAMLARGARGDAAAAAIARHAEVEAGEEDGHDDLLVDDLAGVWLCSRDEARGRLAAAPRAPAVVAWGGLVDGMLARYPEGVVGVALALETIAALHAERIRDALLDRAEVVAIEQAVTFLSAHRGEVERGHAEQGRRRAALLTTPEARSAATFYADAALALFEGIADALAERFAPVGAAAGP